MGRKRRRRTRSDEGGHRLNVDNGYALGQFRYSPYTFEGGLERLRAFVVGVQRAKGWRAALGTALLVFPLAVIAVGIVVAVARLLG